MFERIKMHKEYYYITVVAGVAVADQNNQNFKHDKNKKACKLCRNVYNRYR